MSYAAFLVIFLAIPVAALTVLTGLNRRLLLLLAGLAVIALLYTGPWDNLIVSNGVWTYGRGRVLGILIGHVPLEEYLFYVLQVCLTGLLTALIIRMRRASC